MLGNRTLWIECHFLEQTSSCSAFVLKTAAGCWSLNTLHFFSVCVCTKPKELALTLEDLSVWLRICEVVGCQRRFCRCVFIVIRTVGSVFCNVSTGSWKLCLFNDIWTVVCKLPDLKSIELHLKSTVRDSVFILLRWLKLHCWKTFQVSTGKILVLKTKDFIVFLCSDEAVPSQIHTLFSLSLYLF